MATTNDSEPAAIRRCGVVDVTGPMGRGHVEMSHQIRRLGQLVDDVGPGGLDEEDIGELRRLLYGLHAVLRLHTAQEEESYLSLGDEAAGRDGLAASAPGVARGG